MLVSVVEDVYLAGTEDAGGTATADPADLLDREKCIQLLAELRHAKWFQVLTVPHLIVIYAMTS